MRGLLNKLHLQVTFIVVFTDSLCVLYWFTTKKLLSSFVTNRLKEIKTFKGVTFRVQTHTFGTESVRFGNQRQITLRIIIYVVEWSELAKSTRAVMAQVKSTSIRQQPSTTL